MSSIPCLGNDGMIFPLGLEKLAANITTPQEQSIKIGNGLASRKTMQLLRHCCMKSVNFQPHFYNKTDNGYGLVAHSPQVPPYSTLSLV